LTGLEALGLHGNAWADIGGIFLHFAMLSLLSVGGALAAAPDMQQFLVVTNGWMSDANFTAAVALAQAAPGPNVLFVALLGWKVAGLAGMTATMMGIMLPSSLLTLLVGRYRNSRADSLAFRALTAGLTPLVLGLLLSTGWILLAPTRSQWSAVALVVLTVLVMLRSKVSPLLLIALGAAVGMAGLV
jgi:chromate transporter